MTFNGGFKTRSQIKADEYRNKGFMTAPEIARLYSISAPYVRKMMVVPDELIRKPSKIFFYKRDRVEQVFGKPEVTNNAN
jgi:hypothetical protein